MPQPPEGSPEQDIPCHESEHGTLMLLGNDQTGWDPCCQLQFAPLVELYRACKASYSAWDMLPLQLCAEVYTNIITDTVNNRT